MDDLVDQAVLHRLLGCHDEVAVCVLTDLVGGLSRVVHQDRYSFVKTFNI